MNGLREASDGVWEVRLGAEALSHSSSPLFHA